VASAPSIRAPLAAAFPPAGLTPFRTLSPCSASFTTSASCATSVLSTVHASLPSSTPSINSFLSTSLGTPDRPAPVISSATPASRTLRVISAAIAIFPRPVAAAATTGSVPVIDDLCTFFAGAISLAVVVPINPSPGDLTSSSVFSKFLNSTPLFPPSPPGCNFLSSFLFSSSSASTTFSIAYLAMAPVASNPVESKANSDPNKYGSSSTKCRTFFSQCRLSSASSFFQPSRSSARSKSFMTISFMVGVS